MTTGPENIMQFMPMLHIAPAVLVLAPFWELFREGLLSLLCYATAFRGSSKLSLTLFPKSLAQSIPVPPRSCPVLYDQPAVVSGCFSYSGEMGVGALPHSHPHAWDTKPQEEQRVSVWEGGCHIKG